MDPLGVFPETPALLTDSQDGPSLNNNITHHITSQIRRQRQQQQQQNNSKEQIWEENGKQVQGLHLMTLSLHFLPL